MSEVQQLYHLQQYDSEIAQKKQRLTEVVQAQKETAELVAARNRALETAAEVSELSTIQADQNLELGTVNDKANRSENRLYSGKVTNPKELEDLQNELAALGRRRGVLEDEILETMILLEDAQNSSTAAQATLENVETTWKMSQASLQEEQNSLALDLHQLMSKRASYAERLDSKSLSAYESIRERKNGLAVVKLVDNKCMGCHVGVSAQIVRQAASGERVTCNGCGRILFLQ